MRKAGIVIIAAGLLITVVTGFGLLAEEKIAEIDSLEVTAAKNHRTDWAPMAGILVMVFGGTIILAGAERK